MLRLLLLNACLVLTQISMANTIIVKNNEDIIKANKDAKPSDIIVFQNGEWKNLIISLNCKGTKEQPIIFKAETTGKVFITGKSKLNFGGSYIIVDGLYFKNGYSGSDAIVKFCIGKNEIANNCRITNTVIDDFNNPKRLDENYWVALYGKNNRIDHCSFFNKKNLGVMLAVILADDRSRENFHSIDHNYFGVRLPLASNAGEIIRVGVSEHCEFNSNTQIIDNFFEHCDGETEVISVKSCHNIIRNNLFKECQGGVVLRHGNYNTVENNIFLGNNKAGSGGVRIINKGQWVINNLFYKCRGVDFRSPLSIMNGVPNSPANRYVAVTDAVIANNSFFESTPISFCEGSDAERSITPSHVQFVNNIFYNTKDSIIYNTYDDMSKINFTDNMVSKSVKQQLNNGFIKTVLITEKANMINIPKVTNAHSSSHIIDSIHLLDKSRFSSLPTSIPGFFGSKLIAKIEQNAYSVCGAKWFNYTKEHIAKKQVKVDCKNANDIVQQLAINNDAALILNLTGQEYDFSAPLNVYNDVVITSTQKTTIKLALPVSNPHFFIHLKAGKSLSLSNLTLDLSSINSKTFITTDTSGSCNHSNFSIKNCTINNSNSVFFNAAISSVLDSAVITNCTFNNGSGVLFNFGEELDKKGYYSVEQLRMTSNSVTNFHGQILTLIRSGKDESTMGPLLNFSNNKINDCITSKDQPLINVYGTQHSFIEKNIFTASNTEKILIQFEDAVRADHIFRNNTIIKSGKIIEDKFVRSSNNIIK